MQTHTIEPEAVVAAEAPPGLSKEDEQFLMWLEEETHTVEPEAVVAAETPPGLSEEDEQFIAWPGHSGLWRLEKRLGGFESHRRGTDPAQGRIPPRRGKMTEYV